MRWICLALVAACSSNDTPPAAPDAAYDTARCLIKGNYGALGTVTGTAGSVQQSTTITINLDPGPPGKDDLFFKLVPNQGVFAGGVKPGTYTIAGTETGFTTCALCVEIIADIKPMQGPSKFYQADAGMVTLTSTTAGSVTNLHFSEVDLAGNVVAGGCEATIASAMFSAM